MERQIKQLIEWHTKFEVPFRTEPDPFDDSDEEMESTRLRHRIMKEEIDEWKDSAIYCEDADKRVKELADILYVVFGTVIKEGLQDHIEKAFDLVHESNLSKLDDNGKPIKRADGKVLKGPNYKEPDMSFAIPNRNGPDYDLPMNWEPNYNLPDQSERRHNQAENKKLK